MTNKANGHGIPLEFDGLIFTPENTTTRSEGRQLLDDVACFLNRFVRLSEPQAAIVTLWIVHTHAIRLATTTPYLAITSAEKQSGKTRLLEVLELLVNKPWLTGHATAASLIRKIDKDRPTLLLDESDAAFQGDKQYAEALRGVLNTGHRRGGQASCCMRPRRKYHGQGFSDILPQGNCRNREITRHRSRPKYSDPPETERSWRTGPTLSTSPREATGGHP